MSSTGSTTPPPSSAKSALISSPRGFSGSCTLTRSGQPVGASGTVSLTLTASMPTSPSGPETSCTARFASAANGCDPPSASPYVTRSSSPNLRAITSLGSPASTVPLTPSSSTSPSGRSPPIRRNWQSAMSPSSSSKKLNLSPVTLSPSSARDVCARPLNSHTSGALPGSSYRSEPWYSFTRAPLRMMTASMPSASASVMCSPSLSLYRYPTPAPALPWPYSHTLASHW